MKTFETEIHEKPIAATHYRDECNEYEFSWVRFNNNSMFVWDDTYWDEVKDDNFKLSVKPIKTATLETQMKIDNLATQTPEEKEALDSINSDSPDFDANFERYSQKLEDSIDDGSLDRAVKDALDLIDTTPHQYEMSKFSGNEWKNGDVVYDSDGNEITIINTGMIYGLDNTGTYDYWDCEDLCKTKPESPEAKEKREWVEKFAHKVKHVGTMTYKDILGEMYDSLKGESK